MADLVLARARVLGEQAHRGEDHPARAVPALERVVLVEALLERMERAVRGKALDRRDLAAVRLDTEQRAGLHRFAVQQHRAGAARRGVAADDGYRQPEPIAQDVDEQLARFELELVGVAVDRERDAPHEWPPFPRAARPPLPGEHTPGRAALPSAPS